MKIYCLHDTVDIFSIYLKADNTLNLKRLPFFLPNFATDFRARMCAVVRIDNVGKSIQHQFAHKYYSHIGGAIEIIAADSLADAQNQRHPWSLSVNFDNSLAFTSLLSTDSLDTINAMRFTLNGSNIPNNGFATDIVDMAIEVISKAETIKTGDFIVIPLGDVTDTLKIGDLLCISDSFKELLRIPIR